MTKELKLKRKWKHYGLRTSAPDGTAHGGSVWPETGTVECPDWIENNKCGNGLHALINGEGDADNLNWGDARWQIVGFDSYVDLSGKVKFPRCEVATGTREEVTNAVKRLTGGAVHGGNFTAGDSGTATAGDRGTATAGVYGTATAGDRGIIQIKHWDGNRYRIITGYVGENGIKPNVAYKLNDRGEFVEAVR